MPASDCGTHFTASGFRFLKNRLEAAELGVPFLKSEKLIGAKGGGDVGEPVRRQRNIRSNASSGPAREEPLFVAEENNADWHRRKVVVLDLNICAREGEATPVR